jgi:hypothetical protein
MDVPTSYIDVSYSTARTSFTAKKLIDEIAKYPVISADFEVAIKYSTDQLESWKALLDSGTLSKAEASPYLSKVMATALDHPSHCTITHCSIATSDNQAYVFILDNTSITNYILNYLITTKQKQIWHNASYDFRFLQYFTGKLPYDYEDTQILAKCLINHVNTFKAKTGLKELAGHMYGSWAISKDNFSIEHMYDEHVLKYSAIDSCATYWVYNYMMTECDSIDTKILSANIDWEAPF